MGTGNSADLSIIIFCVAIGLNVHGRIIYKYNIIYHYYLIKNTTVHLIIVDSGIRYGVWRQASLGSP